MNEDERIELVKVRGKIEEISNSLDALIDSSECAPTKELIYEERRHFEGLFKDRISLQLVFSTLLLYVVYRGVTPGLELTIPLLGAISLQRIILIVGSLVSVALLQAVFRTYQLATLALREIISKWPKDPYPTYRRRVWLWNANRSLLGASIVLTLLFLFLAFCGVS